MDKVIASYSETELAKANIESFEHDGYTFVIINLPNTTLLFNQTIASNAGVDQAWSILKSDANGDTPWRARFGVFDQSANRWIFGDKQNTNIGGINSALATHYGEIAEWILYTPFVYLEDMSIDEIDIETIGGFNTDDDATVFLSMTYNGVTYGQEWTEMYSERANYDLRS